MSIKDIIRFTMNINDLCKVLKLEEPVISLSESSSYVEFEPVMRPKLNQCIWASYRDWKNGKTLVLSKKRYGCRGGARFLLGFEMEDFNLKNFLYEEEGLKSSLEMTEEWIKNMIRYCPKKEYVLIGPFKEDHLEKAISFTFLVNPDQLSALIHGALYFSPEMIPELIKTTVSAGCGLLASFTTYNEPQAFIGAVDMAMRHHIPLCLLAFTVNKLMLDKLLSLDGKSFLYKSFWKRLIKERLPIKT